MMINISDLLIKVEEEGYSEAMAEANLIKTGYQSIIKWC